MVKPQDAALDAWSALLTAHRALTAQLDRDLRAHGDMTLDEYDVLFQLRSAGSPLRMAEVAERVLISRASTTRVVDRLVTRGWVVRWTDDADRRVVLVELTSAGRRQQGRAARVHLDGIAEHFETPLVANGATSQDLAALARMLRSLVPGAGT